MTGPYDDILCLPHHVSPKRPRMSVHDRAAQFSPFAALTGYEASIQEMRRIVETPGELEVDAIAMLNEKLQQLAAIPGDRPCVEITYFVPDKRKQGGAYVRARGHVARVDGHEKVLLLSDGRVIPFERIYELEEL